MRAAGSESFLRMETEVVAPPRKTECCSESEKWSGSSLACGMNE